LTEDEMDESWQWIEPDGTRYMKTRAAMRLLESLRWTAPVARVVRFAHLEWIVGLANGFFNLIRVKAGRFVPNVDRVIRWP